MWPFDDLSEKSFHMLENKPPAKKTTIWKKFREIKK